MSEQRHPETLHQPGSAPDAQLHIASEGSAEPFFNPKNIAHTDLITSEANHILLDKKRTGRLDERVVSLANLTINAFNQITGNTDPQLQADLAELNQLHNAASSLQNDRNAAYLLELVDETTQPTETATPIAIAKYIKRVHSLHKEPELNLLLIKLWVIERMEADMPTDYQKHLTAEPPKRNKAPNMYTIISSF